VPTALHQRGVRRHHVPRRELLPHPLNDLPAAVTLIASVCDAPVAEVRRRLALEHQQMGANVVDAMRQAGIQGQVVTDALGGFYAATDAFLYETYTWNRYAAKQRMRGWLLDYFSRHCPAGASILAYGDGLGFDSTALAMAGHRVTYFEVGRRNIAFARKVFEANGAKVEIISNEGDLQARYYDALICLDVLEHVPDPPALVAELANYVKPGGHFLVHAPFWFVHASAPTHLAANRRFCGERHRLYASAGLKSSETSLFWNPIALRKSDIRVRRSWRSHIKLALGWSMLRFSRYCPWPLITMARAAANRDRRRLVDASQWLWDKSC